MQQRPIRATGITTSEIGFGIWTIASGWWGTYTEREAKTMIREAFDLGVTFFNTANVYGEDGYGERIVAEALEEVRDQVVIATTFGYDADAPHSDTMGGEDADRPHDWSRDNVMRSLENSLKHLKTDHIDMWQLQNPRMDAMHNDELWELLSELRSQGVVRSFGPSIGPAIGWRDEGMYAIEHRDIDFFHHIHNMLEQDPGNQFTEAAAERDIALLVRMPHSSGLLEDQLDEHTTFDANDHRSHRTKESLAEGLQKVESLLFLLEDREQATMTQLALKWLLAEPAVATVLPNVYNIEQLRDFVSAPNIEELDADELGEIATLYRLNFGVDAPRATLAGATQP